MPKKLARPNSLIKGQSKLPTRKPDFANWKKKEKKKKEKKTVYTHLEVDFVYCLTLDLWWGNHSLIKLILKFTVWSSQLVRLQSWSLENSENLAMGTANPTRSSSTCLGPINGSNITLQSFIRDFH